VDVIIAVSAPVVMFPAMPTDAEEIACTPAPLGEEGFNPDCKLPFGLTIGHVRCAMASDDLFKLPALSAVKDRSWNPRSRRRRGRLQ
jgi:hypothetical protein